MRKIFLFAAVALAVISCKKDGEETYIGRRFNDAEHLQFGLVSQPREGGSGVIALMGYLTDEGVVRIPVDGLEGAKAHFRSLTNEEAYLREVGNKIVWPLYDTQEKSQGEAVFLPADAPLFARVTLPSSCDLVHEIQYISSDAMPLQSLLGSVQEDLEDNYYYGAIVQISDHGCGSGKFVVFREYNPANDSPGMAVRIDNHHWYPSELKLKDNAARVYDRASCLSTLETAGGIYRSDKAILAQQLRNAGCTALDQHYASSSKTWNGWHYYYCLHDGESDWIGPVNDTDFYECWIYWFKPQGNSISFW